jgi:hypothetical protein
MKKIINSIINILCILLVMIILINIMNFSLINSDRLPNYFLL